VRRPTVRHLHTARQRSPLILLWGLPEEGPLAAVHHVLQMLGAETVMVDQRRALSTRLLSLPGGPVLRLPDKALPLNEVTAVYPRPYPLPWLCDDSPAPLVVRRHLARLEHELWQWIASTTATVINRPGPAASNSTKPIQTRVARACGFRVPDTLFTNSLEETLAFAARHSTVVYKAAGGTRTYTGLLDLADVRRLHRLSTCPTYFQRYIAGTNVRVHVVGTDAFAVEIASDSVDYRRHVRNMAPITLPGLVAKKCKAITKQLELLVSGIDLIRTPHGEWYFLEANPSPAFTYYPDCDEVGAAIARLLIGLIHSAAKGWGVVDLGVEQGSP
jgi:hypothetical protein